MRAYAKAIAALVGALATWGITAAEDNVYTQAELWGAAFALATAATVFGVPNEPAEVVDAERGEVPVIEALLVVFLVIVILVVLGVV